MAVHRGERRFSPAAESAAEARHFLRAALESVTVADPPIETAVLLVSELVTNAFLHARTEIVVRYSVRSTAVHVEVSDGEGAPPRPRNAPEEATDGRGLVIVSALASRWGIDAADHGKSVWFELPIAG